MGLRLPKIFGSSVKRASRVKYTFKSQVVEAIRISYELAGNTTDHAELCATLVALESVIDAAVNAEDEPEKTTTDKLNEFVSCLKSDSMVERMVTAKSKDNKKVTQSATQSLRLDNLLEKVKQAPLLRSKHFFVLADPRIDVTVEIPSDAKLPDILWKFHRLCGKDTPSNPHFYPDAAFEEEVITQILPLRDRNKNKNGGKWTERIFVYGDSREGRIRLTSGDETITRLFGAVTRCLVRPLTLFKDIEGHLLAEEEVDQVFLRARNLKCFRWQDSSFVIDPDVRTVQDVIDQSKGQENVLISSPLSMEPTDFRPPELRHSMSVLSATLSSGPSRVNQPSSVGTSSILPMIQPQGFMDHRAQRTSGDSTTYTPSRGFSRPPWQEAPSGSLSTPIAPHHSVTVDPSPRPSHRPPTIPEPGRVQNFSSSVTPEVAKAQQVELAEETQRSIAAANGGAGLVDSPASSSTTTLAKAESWRDGAPSTHREDTGSPALDIPRPIRQSRPPLYVPTPSSSQDGSTISSSPVPSSLWSPRVDTPVSIATSLSPSTFTYPLTSNSSFPGAPAAPVDKPLSGASEEGLYGTATIQPPNPTEPRRSTRSQSPPSSTPSSKPSTLKGSGKPSPPPSLRQAQGGNRSFWRRTVDGVSNWWNGPKM